MNPYVCDFKIVVPYSVIALRSEGPGSREERHMSVVSSQYACEQCYEIRKRPDIVGVLIHLFHIEY
jgi:hypothetical protein